MTDPQSILVQFLSLVTDDSRPEYGRQYLTKILQPSLALEASIRDPSFGAQYDPADPYVGLFNPFILPKCVRVVHARPENAPMDGSITARGVHNQNSHFTYYSEAAHVICSFPRHVMFPLRRALFRATGTPCMVNNLDAFEENLRIFTHGALADISSWDNMVITGGSVVASLCGPPPRESGEWTALETNMFFQSDDLYRTSDVDIFLYALTPEQVSQEVDVLYRHSYTDSMQAIAKIEEIYFAISKSTLWPVTIVRKADRISIHSACPHLFFSGYY